MPDPVSRILSSSQLTMLGRHGEERAAEAGETLFEVGDERYPFIAILEGEVSIRDPAGIEIVRHGAGGFLGEMNLLSGQTVFLTAVAIEPMRYIAVDREVLRGLLFEDAALADLLLPAFVQRREMLQERQGIGIEIVGPRDSSETRQLLEFARRQRLPYTWDDPEESADARARIERLDPSEVPLVRLPGGIDLTRPSNGELSRALGIGLRLEGREEVDLLVVGGGPAGLGAAVYGASEGLDTLVVESTVLGGQAGTSRRIENYLGFPAGISGTELISRAITQARKFHARTATPYRAASLQPGEDHHLVRLEEGNEVAAQAVLLSTGAEYRRLPVDGLERYEGLSIFYSAGPPEGHLCGGQRVGVIGGGNSAGQAAVWLARGGALVTLLHRRADLGETMSRYLIDEVERFGVAVRDRSEVSELHGDDGMLESVTLTDGAEVPLSYLFLFLGASPCTGWLGDVVERDENGFILTGPEAEADGLLETSVPGIYAAGDVRAGSIKRCATAVGEGATVVRFIHEHTSLKAQERQILSPISSRESVQIERANASGGTPVVFVHGLWLLPNSWDKWGGFFEEGGYAALTPDWPHDPETVEAARADPEVFAKVTLGEIADHTADVIGGLERKPVVIGHSTGGLLTYMLAGRGLAAVSVPIDPGPFRGVLPLPPSSLKAASPVLRNPLNRGRAVTLTLEQFKYGWANALGDEEAEQLYETHHVAASGIALNQMADANLNPFTEAKVDSRNPERGPMLIISGEKDHTVPWAIAHAAYKKESRNEAVTEITEIPDRGHSLTIDGGWGEVAQTALDFVRRFA